MDSEIFSYQTVASEGKSEFKDRGSKFLGYCYEVESREEIKEKLKQLKEVHPKANHHCYAWRLGIKGIAFRTNDNGEPSGSAGQPIMRQIDRAGLTNVLVVVIRYFGGTLLGIPGLVHAYKTTAADCLADTPQVEKAVSENVKITFDYTKMNAVMALIKKLQLQIKEQDMGLFCTYEMKVPVRDKAIFLSQIERLDGVELSE